jgi:hypothetical protein
VVHPVAQGWRATRIGGAPALVARACEDARMSDEHDPHESVKVTPTLWGFSAATVVTFAGMFLAIIYNSNGGGF